MVIALIVIDLANAVGVWLGLSLIAKSIEHQQFHSYSSQTQNEVIALSNNRFAVVQSYNISVYQVDASDKLTRLSDVNTLRSNLTPQRR